MRITRDTLIRIARETAIKRSLSEPNLVAAYLKGSMITPDPFLGGAADVDLVLVHEQPQPVRREIVPITPEIHLDIIHSSRSEYDNPKDLRFHPILGPELYNPVWLYEPHHFLEFVQAAVRTKYFDPVNVHQRAASFSTEARQVWLSMQGSPPQKTKEMLHYLQAIGYAADSIAMLSGGPLAERRFLLDFPRYSEAAGQPGLAAGILGLLGGNGFNREILEESLPSWEIAFLEAAGSTQVHTNISVHRLGYYKNAFRHMLEIGHPQAAVWPLLHTWTLAVDVLPEPHQEKWSEFCLHLGLSAEHMVEKIHALDIFLEMTETLLEKHASSHGL